MYKNPTWQHRQRPWGPEGRRKQEKEENKTEIVERKDKSLDNISKSPRLE